MIIVFREKLLQKCCNSILTNYQYLKTNFSFYTNKYIHIKKEGWYVLYIYLFDLNCSTKLYDGFAYVFLKNYLYFPVKVYRSQNCNFY